MGKKLYIGNLSYNTTESNLVDTFSTYGTVESARLMMDRDSGRSKGFAFIEMGSDDEAMKAISGLDGSQYDGRAMNVSEARPPTKRETARTPRGW